VLAVGLFRVTRSHYQPCSHSRASYSVGRPWLNCVYAYALLRVIQCVGCMLQLLHNNKALDAKPPYRLAAKCVLCKRLHTTSVTH